MHFASRIFAVLFTAACASAGFAAADPAPIVYAGQGQGSTQTASLAGGGDNSYGYGSTSRPRAAAVIDIRRPSTPQASPVNAPVVVAQTEAPAAVVAAPTAEQGTRPGWLEQERVGPPYEANGRWYVPTPEPGYQQTGMASWYGPQFHGQRTANGEVFDQEGMTAAHPTLPLNSLVQVTNLENGREVIVRVTDRGPFVGERLIDLSHGAAVALGFEHAGHAQVNVRYLGPAPRRVNADGSSAADPAPSPAPAPPSPAAPQQEGPASLLPPPAAPAQTELAGAPVYQLAQVTPVAASGGYFVQVGAYSDLTNAHRVRDAVAAAGPVSVDVRQTANGELFRVRIGPLVSRGEADAAQRLLASLGYAESIVAAR